MKKQFLGLAFVLGLAVLSNAQETYSTWSGHRNLYLNTQTNGASVAGNVMNFPVLVRLVAKDSAVFTAALAGGNDIRFTKAGDVVRLKHQIESWDATAKTAAIWVLVDTVKGGNGTQLIRMHWGKAGAADSSNGTAVFSNGFTNVWHLGNAAGMAPRPNAITGGNSATLTNFPGAYASPVSIIGKGEYLRGGNGYSAANPTASNNNDYLSLGTITTDYSQGFTFSVWIKPDGVLGNNTAYYTASEAAAGTATGGLIVVGGQGTEGALGAKFRQRNATSGSNSGIINTDGQLAGTLGVWSHIVTTLNANGDMNYFLNGTVIGSTTSMSMYSNVTRPINNLGTSLAHMQYIDTSFHGTMDEARLANVGRSQDWAKLEYENQREAQTLLSETLPPVALGAVTKASSRQGLSARSSGREVVFQVSGVDAVNGRLSVSDMHGRTVWEGAFAPGSNRLAWDAARAPSGIYLASLRWMDGQGRAHGLQAKVPLTR